MIPIRDNQIKGTVPLVTWALIALNVGIYLWDRHLNIFGPSIAFADLSMRPLEVVHAATRMGDRFPLVTVFTSLFLHGSPTHLLGNMIFLLVFGAGVEDAFGSMRYAVYYLAWGFCATAAQIWVDPNSTVPNLGASGAIGGVMGAYFLMFPTSKVEIFVPILAFLSFEVSAWILLGLWFFYQVFFPQEGVANWAHVGGFLAGMVSVLIAGGRRRVLPPVV